MGYWLLAVVIWAMALPTVMDLIRRRAAGASKPRLIQLLTLSLGVFGQSNAIRLRVDSATGINCLGIWISYTLLTVSSASLWILVAMMMRRPGARPARNRVRASLAAVTVVVMALLLFGSGAADGKGSHFMVVYGARPRVAAFVLVFMVYLAVMNIDLLRLTLRARRYPRSPYLRTGLYMLIVGAGGGTVYVCYVSAMIVARLWHLPPPAGATTLAGAYLGYGTISLTTIGPTISVWGPWLIRPWQAFKRYRALRELAPLARALEPLVPPQISYERTFAEPEHHLVRQLVALRDAMFQLIPYRSPELHARAESSAAAYTPTGMDLKAATEACLIVLTLQAWAATTDAARQEAARTSPAVAPSINPRLTHHLHGNALIQHELRELLNIARAFTRLFGTGAVTVTVEGAPPTTARG